MDIQDRLDELRDENKGVIDMRPIAEYARTVERDVARDTLGCDSLEEYLLNHAPGR